MGAIMNKNVVTWCQSTSTKPDLRQLLKIKLFYPLCKKKFLGGYIGFTVSVRLSVRRRIRPPHTHTFFVCLFFIGSISFHTKKV